MKAKTTVCYITLTQKVRLWDYFPLGLYRKSVGKEIFKNREGQIFLAFPSDKIAKLFPIGKIFSSELLIGAIKESEEVARRDLFEKRGAMRMALDGFITPIVVDEALQKIEGDYKYVVTNTKLRT